MHPIFRAILRFDGIIPILGILLALNALNIFLAHRILAIAQSTVEFINVSQDRSLSAKPGADDFAIREQEWLERMDDVVLPVWSHFDRAYGIQIWLLLILIAVFLYRKCVEYELDFGKNYVLQYGLSLSIPVAFGAVGVFQLQIESARGFYPWYADSYGIAAFGLLAGIPIFMFILFLWTRIILFFGSHTNSDLVRVRIGTGLLALLFAIPYIFWGLFSAHLFTAVSGALSLILAVSLSSNYIPCRILAVTNKQVCNTNEQSHL